jgi:hypothetical protein
MQRHRNHRNHHFQLTLSKGASDSPLEMLMIHRRPQTANFCVLEASPAPIKLNIHAPLVPMFEMNFESVAQSYLEVGRFILQL